MKVIESNDKIRYNKTKINRKQYGLRNYPIYPDATHARLRYGYFSKLVANNTAITQPVREYALDAVRQIPHEDFLTIWKAVTLAIDSEGQPDFHINVPLLLLHGDQDKTGTIKRDMPQWVEHDRHAELHVIPSAGHNTNQDNPTITNQHITDFLSRLNS